MPSNSQCHWPCHPLCRSGLRPQWAQGSAGDCWAGWENPWGGAGARCSGEKTGLCTRTVQASVHETLAMKRNGKVPGAALFAGL